MPGKPNEWWMVKRAAKHVLTALWTSDSFWTHPDSIMDAFDTIQILRGAAAEIPERTAEEEFEHRRKRWMDLR